MPRRNYHRRPRHMTDPDTATLTEREPTFEELARRLVTRGLRTAAILDHPSRWTITRQENHE